MNQALTDLLRADTEWSVSLKDNGLPITHHFSVGVWPAYEVMRIDGSTGWGIYKWNPHEYRQYDGSLMFSSEVDGYLPTMELYSAEVVDVM